MVLMALSLSSLNAATPKTMEENPEAPKVVMVEDMPEQEIGEATYVMSPELQGDTKQSSAPFGWPQLALCNIKYTQAGKSRMYEFDMVFATSKMNDYGKNVGRVYLIPKDNLRPKTTAVHPPEVIGLIYHDIGDADEFCGAIVVEKLLDKNGNVRGTMKSEVPLDRNSAQMIINLATGHTKWDDKTAIKIQTVQTSKLLTPKVMNY